MKVLLDTNVISELRKGSRADANVLSWFSRLNDEDVYLSVLVIGEIRKGIENIRLRDRASATALEAWLGTIVTEQGERIIAVDQEVAEVWGRFGSPDPISTVDGLIAATAHVHGLTVATRNVRDVERTGVPCVNPWGVSG